MVCMYGKSGWHCKIWKVNVVPLPRWRKLLSSYGTYYANGATLFLFDWHKKFVDNKVILSRSLFLEGSGLPV